MAIPLKLPKCKVIVFRIKVTPIPVEEPTEEENEEA